MDEQPTATKLELSEADMRRLGYQIVDMIVDHQVNLSAKRVTSVCSRIALERRLREPAPEHGQNPFVVLEQLERDVLPSMMYTNHPRFFAFVPGPGNFVGAMADALSSGYNIIASLWTESSAPAQIELVVVDWLRELCGLPSQAGGLFVSGGSVANLTALAVARQRKLGGRPDEAATVYCSDQTHGSLQKSLRLLGFQPGQVRRIPTDKRYRLDVGLLSEALASDRSKGHRPFCVIANAGTTNTGAVDPLDKLARLCRQQGLWLHADGAYGAAARICDEGRTALAGIENVDSLAIDPHKWLFQPFEIGAVLVRDARWLRQTFSAEHEYMQDTMSAGDSEEVDFCDYGPQLTRGFRALKLWMSIKVFGLSAFRSAVERSLRNAELVEALLRERPEFQVVTPAQLAVVTFRYVAKESDPRHPDDLNRAIMNAAIDDGYAMLSTTQLDGRSVLRLCTINPRTTEQDLRGTVEKLSRLAANV